MLWEHEASKSPQQIFHPQSCDFSFVVMLRSNVWVRSRVLRVRTLRKCWMHPCCSMPQTPTLRTGRRGKRWKRGRQRDQNRQSLPRVSCRNFGEDAPMHTTLFSWFPSIVRGEGGAPEIPCYKFCEIRRTQNIYVYICFVCYTLPGIALLTRPHSWR